jgi:hypothetical protein
MPGMRRISTALPILLAGAVVLAAPERATAGGALIDEADIDAMRAFVQVPVTVTTLRGLNPGHARLSEEEIVALDQAWRDQRETVGDRPLVAELMARPLSNYLLRKQAEAGGLYTEIFVVTEAGLNAGQSAVTSDFWQGDEDKFTRTFPEGADAVFVDEPELHMESGTMRQQINFTVADPETGAPIGAATVEVNLTELARRRSAGS